MTDLLAPLVDEYLRSWSLIPDGQQTRTLHAVILPVLCNGQAAVLKVTMEAEEQKGMRVLEWAGGRGGFVPVLRSATDAILMPRLSDEPSLARISIQDDAASTSILVGALNRIHRELPGDGLPPVTTLDRWFAELLDARGLHPGILLEGKLVAERLLASQCDISLLHGDLHHRNLLQNAEGEWTAIDPKGLVGERTFDFVNILRNPDGHDALARDRFSARVEQIAREADLSSRRLMEWTLAFCSLSAVWWMSDGVEPVLDLQIARLAATGLNLDV